MNRIPLMLLLLIGLSVTAQHDTIQPTYSGGWDAYYTYIVENIDFPCAIFQEKMDKGEISFYVEADGTVSGIHIACCKRSGYEKALMKVIKQTSGMWKPGTVNGTPAKLLVTTPLNFSDYADIDYYERGLKKMKQKDYKSAIKDFCRHIHQNPEAGEAYCAMGTSNYELGNTKQAIMAWEKAMELGSKKKKSKLCEACMEIAKQYIEKNQYSAAITIYSKALKYAPGNTTALFNRGIAYMRLKQIKKACDDWKALKEHGSSKADDYLDKYCS